ncbi:SPRY domain-containing SOCS box protein [Nesidiocoris tenuis]|uniref:SPRY domain-containing SOCS box protein n=1 Tax=Nesidiocoris tenuis TaxID=355587 RepID=A0ABN7AYE9_9HEMI|nr:SPRY domain-containing SOCS box protein [Nesidiocoris tenuis]
MAQVERPSQIAYVDECVGLCNCRFDVFLCHCSEDVNSHEWAWDTEAASPSTLLSKQNREVRFHPNYSSGTAAIRGDTAFCRGNVYYWEIKMLTCLYGTDVMVGVGTKAAELNGSPYQFCSLLGSDKESWGFSYTGRLQHNSKTEFYGPPFGKGSVIGIYLDMWKGTLEFFLNRRPLGIAFRSLRNSVLYPMVCSTAAQSGMRVTLSVSHPVSLKLLSLQALRSDQEALKQLLAVPGLRRYLSKYWWLLVGRGDEDVELELPGGGRHGCPDAVESSTKLLCAMCDSIL